jgi:transposase-like protein
VDIAAVLEMSSRACRPPLMILFSSDFCITSSNSVWRWVQCYAPEPNKNKRCRRELKPTNGSCRVDETYVRIKSKWAYGVLSIGARITLQ